MTFGKVGYDLQDVKGWMPLLFWREWLLQQQPEARRTSEEWPIDYGVKTIKTILAQNLSPSGGKK